MIVRETTRFDLYELVEQLHPDSASELVELQMETIYAVSGSFMRSTHMRTLVREDDGRVVAIIGIVMGDGPAEPWMALTTAVEGQRLSLCRTCRNLARVFDIDMKLDVLASNHAGQKLFKLLGFTKSASDDERCVQMERSA